MPLPRPLSRGLLPINGFRESANATRFHHTILAALDMGFSNAILKFRAPSTHHPCTRQYSDDRRDDKHTGNPFSPRSSTASSTDIAKAAQALLGRTSSWKTVAPASSTPGSQNRYKLDLWEPDTKQGHLRLEVYCMIQEFFGTAAAEQLLEVLEEPESCARLQQLINAMTKSHKLDEIAVASAYRAMEIEHGNLTLERNARWWWIKTVGGGTLSLLWFWFIITTLLFINSAIATKVEANSEQDEAGKKKTKSSWKWESDAPGSEPHFI